MTDLSGSGVRVLLIATAKHEGQALSSVPSVTHSFEALRAALLERCGVQREQLRELLDPPDAQTMALAVTQEAQQADSVLLIYFIGHGLLGPGGDLYLAASETDTLVPGMAEHQALSFSSLRQALAASRASSVVVVLDCCFSGRVSLGGGAPISAFTMAPTHGLYLIGSAEQLALAPPDAVHTAFTGEVIKLLTHGDPRGPHLLTLDSMYDAVFRAMRDQQRPLPRRQSGDRSGNLVIAPNPAMPTLAELPAGPDPSPGRCPYPGLDAFEADDADLFFGRERMTERLLTAVAAAADHSGTPGPLVVVGPSGSGKTSLLNAGLLAGLRDGGLPAMPGSTGWPCLRLTPGATPLRRLAAHLNAAAPEATERLREEPGHAVELVDRLLVGRPDQRLIVLVDQLEELFTLCTDQAERAAFLQAVTAIATPVADNPPRGLVIFALRADFYGQAAAHPELFTALRDRQLLVEPMAVDELRAAIEQPATAAGLTLDDGLADVILHELGDDAQQAAGALPLLSHVLWATWSQRAGARLTVAGYRAVGGISHAIATTAEQVFMSLDAPGRHAAQRMLPRLVRVGADVADTARPVELSALVHGLPDVPTAQRVIDRCTDARLLTLDRDTARISHEALLRAWPRLREWVDVDRDWLRARQQLADDAETWERADRDPSLLYRGNRLAALRQRAEEAPGGTTDLEPGLAEFMDTSWRQERRGTRRARLAVVILAALFLLATVGLAGSVVFQQQAATAQDRDVARYLAAEAEDLRDEQPGLAKQLSMIAYQIDRTAGYGAVMSSQRTPGVINAGEAAYDLAPSTNGKILAISTGDAILLRGQGHSGRVSGMLAGPIAVNQDGSLLAAATYDTSPSGSSTVRLWDITDLAHPRQIAAPRLDPAVTSLAVSADGTTLYAGAATGEIFCWDIGDPATPTALPTLNAHAALVDSLAVSLRRNLLASSSVDGQAQLWDLTDAAHPTPLAAVATATYRHTSADRPRLAHRMAFDPSGQLLVTPAETDSRRDLNLWNLDDPRAPQRIRSADEDEMSGTRCNYDIASLVFSPVASHIVGTCGSYWHVWLYETGTDPPTIGRGAAMDNDTLEPGVVVFDPDNAHQLLHATDRGVQVWDLANPAQPGAKSFLPLVPPLIEARLAFRSAGRAQRLSVHTLLSSDVWDVTDVADVKRVSTISSSREVFAQGITLSPDGNTLAAVEANDDKIASVVRLRSTADPGGQPLATVGEMDNGVGAIAFSPTQPILVVSDAFGFLDNRVPPSVRVYDITDLRRPRQIAQLAATAQSFVFSPDGATLTASTLADAETNTDRPAAGALLRSWDLTDPAHPTELWTRQLPPGENFASFVYRPDGALLAVLSGGNLRLWHVDQHQLVGDPVRMSVASDYTPAFSPDGTRLAMITTPVRDRYTEQRPEVWDLTDPDSPVRLFYLPSNETSFFGPLAFSPDGETLAVVRGMAGVDLWDTNPESIVTNLCNAVGDPITPAQWERYLPDRPYQPPCR